MPWIEQVMDAVKNAVQNGIENLSGSSISMNAHPEDGYKFRARTKDELIQSQQLAASARDVGRQERSQDPAASKLNAPEWDERTGEFIPRQAPATSPKAKLQQQGWIL